MNQREAAECLTLLQSAWRGRWTEEQENYWLWELLSFEKADVGEAIRALSRSLDHTPSLAQLSHEVGRLADMRRRRATEHHALGPGPGDADPSTARRIIRMLRARKAELPEHFHGTRRVVLLDERDEPVIDDDGYEVTTRVSGAAACLICARHDHSDARAFGFSKTTQRGEKADREGQVHTIEHRFAVEAWRFSCPGCGDPAAAQELCDTWTPEGLAWMRAHGVTTATSPTTEGEAF